MDEFSMVYYNNLLSIPPILALMFFFGEHRGLAAQPLLALEMRLGEGSGAALAYPLLQAAVAMLSDMLHVIIEEDLVDHDFIAQRVDHFDELASHIKAFSPEAMAANQGIVKTELAQPGGVPIPIEYRMHRKDGEWKVFDVAVDGVSLLTTYRSSFAAEIRKSGIDALIACGGCLLAAGWHIYQKLLVVSELVRQQTILYHSDSKSIPDRIVSLYQAHIRPIIRGKARCNVEFGAKISISVT